MQKALSSVAINEATLHHVRSSDKFDWTNIYVALYYKHDSCQTRGRWNSNENIRENKQVWSGGWWLQFMFADLPCLDVESGTFNHEITMLLGMALTDASFRLSPLALIFPNI